MSRRSWVRRVAATVTGAVLAATGVVAQPGGPPASAAAGADRGSGVRVTKTVTRTRLVDGASQVLDSRDVTVSVDRTDQLRGRERIHVSWRGAHPSGGRAANPFGEAGMAQEYPVVLVQCRGVDDPRAAPGRQLAPETCWTSTRQQRSQAATESAAVWRHDQYADDAQRAQKSGVDPWPDTATCPDPDFFSTHITPFRAADGTLFAACTAETMPPEAAVDATYPASEMAAYTNLDGSGEASFEVRTDVENESLGCNHRTACSLVVIPIMGISCLDNDVQCLKMGRFAPGSSNFAGDGVDAAVSPLYWWSASNWRNRISVPLSFGLPPDACDVLDDRAPTAFYGSELMSQAALQWAPAYCLRRDRFKFQLNRMSDAAAFALMDGGQAPAAMVSGRHPVEGPDRVVYAPTAVTGFAVSFVADRPDNAGEVDQLRLNPRLLAKLLTQSYPASQVGAAHPGLGGNPLSINLDPEFRALNPGLDTIAREAAATVLSLSQSSDVVSSLTSYIARDRDAVAFVSGKPDPWGMVVNPSYQGTRLPVAEWPLKDRYVPPSDLECQKQNPAVYLSQVAAPVSYLRTIAEAVLDAWPNVQTRCDRATPDDPWKLGRIDRQGVGARFMLGVTSLGDAARFGLRTAALQTRPGTYVAPSRPALAAAVGRAEPSGAGKPFLLDQERIAEDPRAYPGTMIVYTATRSSGLDRATAGKVAQFIRLAATEGQRPGAGNGQLPLGFLPITGSGATEPLRAAALAAADVVSTQRRKPPAPSGPPSSRPVAAPAAGPPPPETAGAPPRHVPAEPVVQPAAPTRRPAVVTEVLPVATVAHTPRAATRAAAVLVPLLVLLVLGGAFVGVARGLTSVAVRGRAR